MRHFRGLKFKIFFNHSEEFLSKNEFSGTPLSYSAEKYKGGLAFVEKGGQEEKGGHFLEEEIVGGSLAIGGTSHFKGGPLTLDEKPCTIHGKYISQKSVILLFKCGRTGLTSDDEHTC